MFRVKICGITNIADALEAAEAGADAIGLNCYPASRRYCPTDRAAEIAAAVPPRIRKVGVFVNATSEQIRGAVESLRLDLVQLHGDESPEFLQSLRPVPVIKAFRLAEDYSHVGEYLRQCHRLACTPRMVLVDALSASEYGGTGATVNWRTLAQHRREFAGVPLVLAGGLTPDNVAAAIAAARPWAVDTASGVELSPGQKSTDKVRAFVAAAVESFGRVRR
ncbi:MAG: phosphoribosylanthranilate isomerase [Pirellulales bacterium]